MPGHGGPILHAQNNTLGFGHVLANHATTKLNALQQHIFAWKQLNTQPAQQAGWLPSIENCIARNPAKNAVLATQKQPPLPKGKKKNTEWFFFFFKLQPSINWNMPCMEKPGKLPKPSSLQWEIKLPHQDMTHWNEETHQHLRWELLCLYKQGAGSGQTSGVSHELGKGFGDSSPTSR